MKTPKSINQFDLIELPIAVVSHSCSNRRYIYPTVNRKDIAFFFGRNQRYFIAVNEYDDNDDNDGDGDGDGPRLTLHIGPPKTGTMASKASRQKMLPQV